MDKKIQGKKNRQAGARFELKVRKDLESKGWIVSKWMNNVQFEVTPEYDLDISRLVPAKHKFRGKGIPMAIGTGFPDFVVFQFIHPSVKQPIDLVYDMTYDWDGYYVFGVEVKSNGRLDKIEKEKCQWLLTNNIFSKILIASKGEKRGEIKYIEFKND